MKSCSENNNWTVYVHISPSNKKYVGVTSRKNVNDRWRNGKGYQKNIYFARAIQKYGWENFCHQIVAEHLTKDDAVNMEKFLIQKYKSNDCHYGYNICSGGEGCSGLIGESNPNYGHKWSEEKRLQMSNYIKEHPRHYSEDELQKRSDYMRERWKDEEYRKQMTGKNAPCYGRIGELHPLYGKTGKQSACSKKVVCMNTMKVYVSALAASKTNNINHSKLCMCCRGERKSGGKDKNGTPLRWEYYEDYLKEYNLTDEEARKSLIFIE